MGSEAAARNLSAREGNRVAAERGGMLLVFLLLQLSERVGRRGGRERIGELGVWGGRNYLKKKGRGARRRGGNAETAENKYLHLSSSNIVRLITSSCCSRDRLMKRTAYPLTRIVRLG